MLEDQLQGNQLTSVQEERLTGATFDRRVLLAYGITAVLEAGCTKQERAPQSKALSDLAPQAELSTIEHALKSVRRLEDSAEIEHYPVQNPQHLIVLFSTAHVDGLSTEQLKMLGFTEVQRGHQVEEQYRLLESLARILMVRGFYCDGMTRQIAARKNTEVNAARDFQRYRRLKAEGRQDPEAARACSAMNARYGFETDLEKYTGVEALVESRIPLRVALRCGIELRGIEPHEELRDCQEAIKANPRLMADQEPLRGLILKRDEKGVREFLEKYGDEEVALFYYGLTHFGDPMIDEMNDAGIYVVKMTSKLIAEDQKRYEK